MRRTGFAVIAASLIAVLVDGCATVAEKNTDQCEQAMQAHAEPALVSVTHRQASPAASSVIVSGMMEDQRNSTVVQVQAECRFDGKSLTSFHWLTPADSVLHP